MARAAVIPPISPPKKTGRGRPRTKTPATESDATTNAKSKTAKGKASTSTTEPKRRVGRPPSKKVEVEVDEGTDDEIGIIEAKEQGKTAKSRGKKTTSSALAGSGRGRKAAAPAPVESGSDDDDDDELAQSDIPKRRVGRPRTKPVPKEESDPKPEPAAPRGRGRPRGSKAAKGTAAGEEEKKTGRKGPMKDSSDLTDDSAPKPIYIKTNSSAVRSNIRQGPAKKKTVTFKDVSCSEAEDEEEENLPAMPAVRGRRGTGVEEGMRAKPVRKPATGTGRGRKPAGAKEGASKPLSPKKANQITKTLSSYISSDGEEDELSGEKDQLKSVVDSPVKDGLEHTGLTSPVRRVNFTPKKPKTFDENGQPTLHPARSIDFSDSIYISSPARRPSASPFQYTIKETPRRGGRGLWDGTKSLAQPNLSAIQDSPLKSSPKKGNFGSTMAMPQPNFTPNHSLLKASPKKGSPVKGILGAPSLQPSEPDFGASSPLKISPKKGSLGLLSSRSQATGSTPFTARDSLIQSPAKKIASPFKDSKALKKTHVGEPAGVDADNERRVSVSSGRIASGSPVKAESPQKIDSEVGSKVIQETWPEVSEDELYSAVEYEAQVSAEADGVEMVAKPKAEFEPTDQRNHQVDHVEDGMEVHVGMPAYTANHPDGQLGEGMDGVDNEGEDNDRHRTEYDAYDCAYLQKEVNDSAQEYQRQLGYYSNAGQTNWFDDKHSEPGDNSSDHLEAGMNQDGDLDLMSDARNQPQTPSRLRFPAGLEDVFVDTPGNHGVADRKVMDDNRELPEEIDELKVEELAEGNFEGHIAHSEVQGEDDQGTPIAFDEREPLSVSTAASPYEVPNNTENADAKKVEEPVGVQSEQQSTSSQMRDVEELGKGTQMAYDEPERHRLLSGRTSHIDANQKPEQYENNLDGAVGAQLGGRHVKVDDENTHIALDNSEPNNEGPGEASAYTVYESEGTVTPSHIPPPVPTPPVDSTVGNHGDAFRDTGRYSMTSNDTTIFGSADNSRLASPANWTSFTRNSLEKRQSLFKDNLGFTPLAHQFSQWKASSPGKQQPEGQRRRGVFSLGGVTRSSDDIAHDAGQISYPDISKHSLADSQSLFAELPVQNDADLGSAIYEEQGQEPEMPEKDVLESVEAERQPMSEITGNPEHHMTATDNEEAAMDQSMPASNPPISKAPSGYSAPREQDKISEKENIPAELVIPATPVKSKTSPMRTVHTVSKVPLKPEGEVSPLKVPRKRGRSLGNTSPVHPSTRFRKSIDRPRDHDVHSHPPRKIPRLQESARRKKRATSFGSEGVVPQQNESVDMRAMSASPAKSPRKNIGACSQVLQGVVAHVDVHTTEGEDASGIFTELLQQMGARCVKNWPWNPRPSLSPVDGADPKDGKVGITHVVFKDGGKRTLEKVRQAAGVVKCVGVGWVLDCERENKWLDETPYAVDSTIIPRGGAKRRKSMQPRTLSNVNGTLVKTAQPAVSASGGRSGADWETMEDFMRLSPPMQSRNEPGTPEKARRPVDADRDYFQTPRTPGFTFNLDDIGMSPATPFFLQKANIVQQTCPPKQTRQGLFSASPSAGDELSSQRLRSKLETARRKSHASKPRVSSPLAQ